MSSTLAAASPTLSIPTFLRLLADAIDGPDPDYTDPDPEYVQSVCRIREALGIDVEASKTLIARLAPGGITAANAARIVAEMRLLADSRGR